MVNARFTGFYRYDRLLLVSIGVCFAFRVRVRVRVRVRLGLVALFSSRLLYIVLLVFRVVP